MKNWSTSSKKYSKKLKEAKKKLEREKNFGRVLAWPPGGQLPGGTTRRSPAIAPRGVEVTLRLPDHRLGTHTHTHSTHATLIPAFAAHRALHWFQRHPHAPTWVIAGRYSCRLTRQCSIWACRLLIANESFQPKGRFRCQPTLTRTWATLAGSPGTLILL